MEFSISLSRIQHDKNTNAVFILLGVPGWAKFLKFGSQAHYFF